MWYMISIALIFGETQREERNKQASKQGVGTLWALTIP